MLSSSITAALIGLLFFLENNLTSFIGGSVEAAAETKSMPPQTMQSNLDKLTPLFNSPGFVLMIIGLIATLIITIWIIKKRRMI